ncbi:hypothetical protein ES703_111038 [subsurface metagenome]
MSDNQYDIAQICNNGHIITSRFTSRPESRKKFCDKCGAKTITSCENCNSPIRGYSRPIIDDSGGLVMGSSLSAPPSFCPDCGKPYPWTEAKLKAAQELADLLEDLSSEEREILKKSFDDIVQDTPQAVVAANKIKILIAKVSKIAAEQIRKLVVEIASETARKIILGK